MTSAEKATNPGHATVILSATDVNDNSPTFITDHIFGSVSELARVGDVAAAGIRAFDSDEVNSYKLVAFMSMIFLPSLHVGLQCSICLLSSQWWSHGAICRGLCHWCHHCKSIFGL